MEILIPNTSTNIKSKIIDAILALTKLNIDEATKLVEDYWWDDKNKVININDCLFTTQKAKERFIKELNNAFNEEKESEISEQPEELINEIIDLIYDYTFLSKIQQEVKNTLKTESYTSHECDIVNKLFQKEKNNILNEIIKTAKDS